eukprot:626754-Alexandrium_andersonii.AAC.1
MQPNAFAAKQAKASKDAQVSPSKLAMKEWTNGACALWRVVQVLRVAHVVAGDEESDCKWISPLPGTKKTALPRPPIECNA